MYNNNTAPKGQNTREDRFGQLTMLVACKPNKNGYPVGYLEIGGKLYKLEPSQANKEGVLYWIKATQCKAKSGTTQRKF